MEKFTIEEKNILLGTIGFYQYVFDRTENPPDAGPDGSPVIDLKKLKELNTKILLDVEPIKVRFNNAAIRGTCILCGVSYKPDIGYWAFVDGIPICDECFKKHEPDLCKESEKRTSDYFQSMFNDDLHHSPGPNDILSPEDWIH